MSRRVVLDATPLGMLCHPSPRGATLDCQRWAEQLTLAGGILVVPAVVDYEVRRELIRARRFKALVGLNNLAAKYQYLILTDDMLRHAADLWARARQFGLPTAGARELDADAILAAQALSLNDPTAIVATSNPAHLSRFVRCDLWQNIPTS